MYIIRFVVTAINANGTRQLAFNNNHLNTYKTQELAQKRLNDLIQNNNEETVAKHVGTDLRVLPVECYPTGDATRTIFPEDLEGYVKSLNFTPEN